MYPFQPPHPPVRQLLSPAARAGLLFLVALAGARAEVHDLYEAFRTPVEQSRPFVRWWWNGSRIDAAEIEREIQLMHEAGIGGVEINTIAMESSLRDPTIERHPALPWLSPEWVEMVRTAAAACRARGMTTDLIVGSGWPFGGRFLRTEEQTQRVVLARTVLSGPRSFRLNVHALVRSRFEKEKVNAKGKDLVEPSSSHLLFLRSIPAAALQGSFTEGSDLTAVVEPDGSFKLDLPDGEHLVMVGMWQAGFTHVKLGAPGADGPVVNHFDAAAVRRYLDTMSAAFASSAAGGLGATVRAAFIDSLELDHANWTSDLPAEFFRRRGYELLPYLPFILDEPSTATSAFNDTVLRARYDFCRTLVDLFEERFIATCVAWARDLGIKIRVQAYGREAHVLHGSMGVHLPEGETWLWMDKSDHRKIRVESTAANKYVASAANLTGQRLRSFEAMTNAVPVFRETLENFKQGMDLTVLSGLNHPVLHGFNYSPPDAGYPGWMRFGSYFSEHNPWWRHFRLFTDYAARLGTVMRSTEAQASIALLAPRAEEWARHGLLYQPFPEVHVPWYQYRLAEAIHQVGGNCDYISERILEQGSYAGGCLRFGPRAYPVVILQEVSAIEPAAANGLASFVEAGGTLVFVGPRPDRAPGGHKAVMRDAEVEAAMGRIEAAARRGQGRVVHARPPPEGGLLGWTDDLLREAQAARDVVFDQPRTNISQVFHRDGDRAIYFLVNTSVDEGFEVTASFPAARGAAWLWDAHHGTRARFDRGGSQEMMLRFAPLESKLLIFEPGDGARATAPAAAAAPETGTGEPVTLAGPWRVELQVGGSTEVFHRDFPVLLDLSLQEEEQLRDFGGVLVYRTSFSTPDVPPAVLDLGHVNGTTAVRLNGAALGVRWWGRHVYDLAGRLRPGANSLEIEVTTVLANQMRSLRGNPSAQRWAWWAPPIETGLLGPARLLPAGTVP